MYNEEIIENFFENQKKHLEELIGKNNELETSIANLEERISKETNVDRKKIIERCLVTAKTNLQINILSIKSTMSMIDEIKKLHISSSRPLYSVEDEQIINSLTNDPKDSLAVSTEIIHQKFAEIKNLFKKFVKETNPEKKEQILQEFNTKKAELSSLKSKISCRMRKLHNTNKITPEEFAKFKKEQLKYNKEHYEIYQKMNNLVNAKNIVSTKKPEPIITNVEPVNTPEPIVTNVEPVNTPEPIVTNVESVNTLKPVVTNVEPVNTPEPVVTNVEPVNTPEPIVAGVLVDQQRMKNSKTAEKLIGRVQAAVNTHEKLKETAVNGTKKETKKALKEDKKAQRKISMVRNPEMLKQRDTLAKEISELKKMYGTANNSEYQMRLEQLKELDKMIFGHKATRIYKDFKKPINLIGGTYIELPKYYIDIRLESLGKMR